MIDLTRETPIRADEAAAFMGVHRGTIDNWIAKGLEAFRPGGGKAIYTTKEALSRFMVPVENGSTRESLRESYAASRSPSYDPEYQAAMKELERMGI